MEAQERLKAQIVLVPWGNCLTTWDWLWQGGCTWWKQPLTSTLLGTKGGQRRTTHLQVVLGQHAPGSGLFACSPVLCSTEPGWPEKKLAWMCPVSVISARWWCMYVYTYPDIYCKGKNWKWIFSLKGTEMMISISTRIMDKEKKKKMHISSHTCTRVSMHSYSYTHCWFRHLLVCLHQKNVKLFRQKSVFQFNCSTFCSAGYF